MLNSVLESSEFIEFITSLLSGQKGGPAMIARVVARRTAEFLVGCLCQRLGPYPRLPSGQCNYRAEFPTPVKFVLNEEDG